MAARFLTLADVAESLAVSMAQARAMVRSGELPAIQVGGRNQWRVEATALEDYIARKYEENAARVAAESHEQSSL
ncbi:MAG: helix-turn-helix domain-containing protein [Actinomycetota bacterium]